MKLVKYIFWIAYNLWFYILVLFFTIVVVLHSFIFVLINNKWYKYHYKVGVLWADLILLFMGMFPVKTGALKTKKDKSYIFVANHVSMIDVMLLISVIRNNPLVFIGKKELENAVSNTKNIDFDITYKPFQLDPTMPPNGVDRKKYIDR